MQNNLICFDLDGVLINSMGIANQLFFETMEEELGLSFDYQKHPKVLAMSGEERFDFLWREEIKEKGITDEQLQEALNKYRKRKMSAELPTLPGAQEVVKLMSENFEHMAAVSSNSNYMIEEILERIGLRKYFHKITGLDDVTFSKPDPEIYQKTVDYFGVDPKNALTFEDSTVGITAAKKAGMKAIGVATGVESEEELKETEADLILKDFSCLSLEMVLEIISS